MGPMGTYCTSPDREGSILEVQLQFKVKHIMGMKIKTHQILSMGRIPGFNCTVGTECIDPHWIPIGFNI